jgi:ribosome-binding factor A
MLILPIMDTTRQNKISRLIQKELGEIFQQHGRSHYGGAMITVTNIVITKDLSLAKVYVSLFATKDKDELLKKIIANTKELRLLLAQRVRNQLRVMPELKFYIDDALDYIEKIDKLLKQ